MQTDRQTDSKKKLGKGKKKQFTIESFNWIDKRSIHKEDGKYLHRRSINLVAK
jgi:hypothetical protein